MESQVGKLHCAGFVHNPPITKAVMQNHGDGQKSWHMPKITVFMMIAIPQFSCIPSDWLKQCRVMFTITECPTSDNVVGKGCVDISTLGQHV